MRGAQVRGRSFHLRFFLVLLTQLQISQKRSGRDRPLTCAISLYSVRGRSVGKRMTSRMEVEPVISMTTRSMPMPSPPAGGMSIPRHLGNPHPSMCASASPLARFSTCCIKRHPLVNGVIQLRKGVGNFALHNKSLKAVSKLRMLAIAFGQR